MNANIDYLSIADTDFHKLLREDRAEAENRLVMILCDPELAARRIATLVCEQIDSGISDVSEDHRRRFESTINALGLHGVIPAIDAQCVTLEDLIEVVNDPDALRSAHLAIVQDDAATQPQSLLERCFEIVRLPDEKFVSLGTANEWHPRSLDFTEALGLATRDTPAAVPDREIYYQYKNRVCIQATRDEIPFGLCQLVLIDIADATASAMICVIPELDWQEKERTWFWQQSIDDVFGRPMNDPKVRAFLIVADESNRADFDSDHVKAFVGGLEAGVQRQLAEEYLFGGYDNHA